MSLVTNKNTECFIFIAVLFIFKYLKLYLNVWTKSEVPCWGTNPVIWVVFTAVKIQLEVFCVVMLCSVMVGFPPWPQFKKTCDCILLSNVNWRYNDYKYTIFKNVPKGAVWKVRKCCAPLLVAYNNKEKVQFAEKWLNYTSGVKNFKVINIVH